MLHFSQLFDTCGDMKYIVGHLQIKIFNGIQLVTRLYELTRNNLKLEVCLLGIAGGRHLKADRISQSCFQLIKREISLAQTEVQV